MVVIVDIFLYCFIYCIVRCYKFIYIFINIANVVKYCMLRVYSYHIVAIYHIC